MNPFSGMNVDRTTTNKTKRVMHMLTFDELKEGRHYITKNLDRKRDFTPDEVQILDVTPNHIRYQFTERQKGDPHSHVKTLSRYAYTAIVRRGLTEGQNPMPFYQTTDDYRLAVDTYKAQQKRAREESTQLTAQQQPEQEPEPERTQYDVNVCPHCESARLMHYTLREDNFHGDTDPVNDDSFYHDRDFTHKPALDVLYCHGCYRFIDSLNQTISRQIEK